MVNPSKEGIGDLNSKERGTAARYNAGKVELGYIPMRLLMERTKDHGKLNGMLYNYALCMADFEEGDDDAMVRLFRIIELEYTCEVLAFGAKKYSAWGWAKGFPWMSVVASFKRHWLAVAMGEEVDLESGISHWGHMGCNVVFLAQFIRTWRAGDDRPDKSLFETIDPADPAS